MTPRPLESRLPSTAAEFSPSQSFFLLLVLPNTLSIICHISATQNKKRMLSVEKKRKKESSLHSLLTDNFSFDFYYLLVTIIGKNWHYIF
mgnify:CR=1 FL=1